MFDKNDKTRRINNSLWQTKVIQQRKELGKT